MIAALTLASCVDGGEPVDASHDAPFEAGALAPTDQLDLLLMIDNSGSMTEEQADVSNDMAHLLEQLTSGDHDEDGVVESPPVRSLHVGVVTSDLGIDDVRGLATCPSAIGDDGIMQIRTHLHAPAGCMLDYRPIYGANVFTGGADGARTATQVGTDIGCVSSFGTDGCGYEFDLDSPLEALSLTPMADGSSPVSWTASDYRPPLFRHDTPGHGSDLATNGSFLRAGSVLAIMLVSDEDDSSTPNTQIYSPTNAEWNQRNGEPVDLNLRPFVWEDELYPASRYVDGFAGLRADPRRVVFGAIVGVPIEVSGMSPDVILAHPDMHERVNPANTNQILPACSVTGRGVGYPARRITAVASGLAARGAHTTVHTICSTWFRPAFDAFAAEIASALGGVH